MGLFGNRDAAEDAADWQSAFNRIADERDAIRTACHDGASLFLRCLDVWEGGAEDPELTADIRAWLGMK